MCNQNTPRKLSGNGHLRQMRQILQSSVPQNSQECFRNHLQFCVTSFFMIGDSRGEWGSSVE